MTEYEDLGNPIRAVLGWGKYGVDRCGYVYVIKRGKWESLCQRIPPVGYPIVTFWRRGKGFTRNVHRLVLETFVGPCPKGCETRHLNGNRTDNRLTNLRWGTRKENVADAIRHGTATIGAKNGRAKLRVSDIGWIAGMARLGFEPEEIAPHFKVKPCTIRDVLRGKTYKEVMR